MRRLWATAGTAVALALLVSGSSAPRPPVPEILDAPDLVALGDPAAPPPPGTLRASHFEFVSGSPGERCAASPATPLPVTARIGEAVPRDGRRYTIGSVGLAPSNGRRVWLVADATVVQSGCAGAVSLWEFLFVAADGTIHPPAPQERRGEFTSYDLPAGGWAGGRIFFDLPAGAVPGGAVGFRQPPFAISLLHPGPIRPYGLWPIRWPLPEAAGPSAYPPA